MVDFRLGVMSRGLLGSLLLVMVSWGLFGIQAAADTIGDWQTGGAKITVKDRRELQQIRAEAASAKAGNAGSQFEYASVADCGNNTPESASADDLCRDAALACVGNSPEQGLGPSVRLFRRQVSRSGAPVGPWLQYGSTCFPEDAPGPARPTVTMAMVLAAFHDTDFAKPLLDIEPRGNVTLVTLPTYFQTAWPQAGYQPGEIDQVDPARMAGFRVEIRPRVKSITYAYGDGSTSGPTTSLGGPYPEGDITKTYTRAGDFVVRADVTYSGQFRVNGGQWIDIPGEVTIRGTAETLTVKTAHARLVAH